MKLSKLFFLLSMLTIMHNVLYISPIKCGDAGGGGFDFSSFGGGATGGLMAPPTEEELKQIEEFLQTLSEDELKELADIGKQIIETADQQGIPVFASDPKTQPTPTKKPKPTPEKKVDKTPTKIEEKRIIPFKKIIKELIDSINEIRKKTATEEEFSDEIAIIDKNLNSLIYYLHVVDEKQILNHLLEKDFDTLRNNIESLTNQLEIYNNDFIIPSSVLLELENSKERTIHKKKLAKAKIILESIINLFTKSFTEDLLNEELEKVLKKYEPEALKIKTEEEEKQRRAKEFTRQIDNSPTNRGGNFYSPYSHDYYASINQPLIGSPIIIDTVKNIAPKQQPELTNKLLAHNEKQPKSIPDETKKNSKKEKETKKNHSTSQPTTIAELEKTIPYHLADVEEFLNPKYNTLISFIDDYKENPIEGELTPTLRELTFKLDKAKKEVGKWATLLEKETNFNQFNTSKQKMKDIIANNNQFPTIKELHKRTKKTSNLKDNLKHFHSMMNFIEDKCC